MVIDHCLFLNNSRDITNDQGDAQITDTQIFGGSYDINAISNYGGQETDSNPYLTPMRLKRCRISKNISQSAVDVGGIYNSRAYLSVQDSVIDNNYSSKLGGGILNAYSGIMLIQNSLIYGNKAGLHGGGIYTDGNYNYFVQIENSTIANNSAGTNGGGVSSSFIQNIYVKNSIIADNVVSTPNANGIDFYGVFYSQKNNLIENRPAQVIIGDETGNIYGQDPKLMPLRYFIGKTLPTLGLYANSPAIDAGNPQDFIPFDQRGIARPQDGNNDGISLPDIGAFERLQNENIKTNFDYDGDYKSDASVFRPSTGVWYVQRPSTGFLSIAFGSNGDKVVPADFSGDGKTDVAVWRPADNTWYVFDTSNNTFYGIPFGTAGDIPVPEDFDGDGKADINVFRPSTGFWFRNNSSNGQFIATPFGQNGDVPTVGDYDGDGKADIAVFRPSTGAWYRLNSLKGSSFAVAFGQTGDKVVPADYTGDGRTDMAVFRVGTWYILRSEDLTFYGIPFGLATDVPSAGDYDGDGKADQAVYRNGQWFIQQSTSGFLSYPFGLTGDVPTESAFVY